VKLIVKYYFLANVLFLGGPGRLKSSCIWLYMVDKIHSRFCMKLLGILKCASSELVEVELGGESRRNECRGP
jgi:hypothetical protein